MSDDPWLVIRIKSQQAEMAEKNVRNQQAEFYYPKIEVRSPRTHKLRPEPMFPGYAFVRVSGYEWIFLKSTRGVHDVLMGTGESPARVPAAQIAAIRSREGADGVIKLGAPLFSPGEAVAIDEGAFEGLLGVYEGMSGQERADVLLQILGRHVRASIPLKSISRA